MPATMSVVTSKGAARPGMAAVVIRTSAGRDMRGQEAALALRPVLAEGAGIAAGASAAASRSRLMKVPPIEATSSAEAGRMSLAETRAPSRFAVPIACSPATPAPRTSTLAGGMVPAAVM